ncbi:HAD family hydrolase [Rhizohabitans arisaemae]|uniref:HAD family hydrolase n=1 Tax=Rhizohabitans arisaemae TaxID=2720610 RepID=UPI0024B14C1B|nr:HAD family phosphatase [Rhizohabitans arisaemae]
MKGVLIDWGGVLTTSLSDAIKGWIIGERIDPVHYREVMTELIMGAYQLGAVDGNPVHALERGELPIADFERDLAARLRTLDGLPPSPDGLLERMFAGFHPVPAMYDMLRTARAAGVRTCLLSNSWADHYDRSGWEECFDAVVISGEVGMRKPEERIFRYAVETLGLEPPECVFIDDILPNVEAARAVGIVGLHHVEPEQTLAEVRARFGF